jgi:heat shock protein HslJ
MEPGKDLSELLDTFWHLEKLEGSDVDLSGVIIWVEDEEFTFSTIAYLDAFLFRYQLSGLEFHPPKQYGPTNNSELKRAQRLARRFAEVLNQISSYEFSEGTLTFFDKDRGVIMVLDVLEPQGIENRKWAIAKYRGDGSKRGDKESLIDSTEPAEITFLHGRVEGSPGCGGWDGTYKVSGDHLTVQAGFDSLGYCSPSEEKQTRLVVNAFKGQLRIEKQGPDVLLRDATGHARVLLVPYWSTAKRMRETSP